MSEPFRLKRRDATERLAYLNARRTEAVERGETAEWLAAFDAMAKATEDGDPAWVEWPKVQTALAGMGIAVADDTVSVTITADQIVVARVDPEGHLAETAMPIVYRAGTP